VARKSDNRQAPPGAYPGRRAAAYAGGVLPHDTDPPGSAQQGRDAGRTLRVLALIAVVVGLAALTAAACVLSYSSVHHLAVQAGATGRLASIYPLIFDALLVLAGCSVLALRGAGLISRVYSWLCLLVLLAALAAGGAIRAAAVKVPHRLAAVVAAIVPWALVLIGFGLLLALLRYARLRRISRRNGGPAGAAAASSHAADGAAAGGPTADGPAAGSPAAGSPAAGSPAAGGPAAVTALVSERERETAAQRALIPGLPRRPEARGAQEPAAAPGAGGGGEVAADEGTRAPAGSAAGTGAARTPDAAPAAARPLDADRTVDAVQTTKPAHAAPGGGGMEPPTVPGAAARPRQAPPAGTPSAGQAEQATPAPAASTPPASTAETAAQARPGVRRAEMQLRARIPRQAAEDAGPNPVPPGWPAPFMPQVGQHGAAAARQTGEGPASDAEQPGEHAADAAAGAALPKRVPGQQQVTTGRQQSTAAETNPRNPADPGNPADEPESAAGGGAASSLNPAPTVSDDDDEDGGLPAFRRTRSSPTPPREDEETS
jgi:hypothetical protein